MREPTKVPKRWIRNTIDQRAIEEFGCRWDQHRGDHIVDFFNNHLRLYEGHWLGQPFTLQAWQEDFIRRLFSWVYYHPVFEMWVRRFKKAGLWVSKKNGKSPLAAGIGLYLFVADGDGTSESKVFTAAHDGKQAEIIQKHAIEMTRLCPALMERVRINKQKMTITDDLTGSLYTKIAGANVQGQEGHNGSAIVDEAHVISRKLAETLEYMGASRPEALQLTTSTVGDDHDSWGYEQWEYGENVNSGQVTDYQYLHVHYGVAPGASDRYCQSVKAFKEANPSYGVTIDPEEIKQSAKRAKQKGPRAWSIFKKYRLNMWQRTGAPWLPLDRWLEGTTLADLEEFAGKQCSLALDLAHVRDFATLVATIELEEGEFLQFPFIWVAEAFADSHSHQVDFGRMIDAGDLVASPGDQIDEGLIQEQIETIADILDVIVFPYDPYKAKNLANWCTDSLGWDLEDNGILVPFAQTITKFAAPTGEFERLVIGGKLKHVSNSCYDWQIGHAQVKEDHNNNKRPVKPDSKDVKKVDTVVAGIMSLWGIQAVGETEAPLNYYETHKVEAS